MSGAGSSGPGSVAPSQAPKSGVPSLAAVAKSYAPQPPTGPRRPWVNWLIAGAAAVGAFWLFSPEQPKGTGNVEPILTAMGAAQIKRVESGETVRIREEGVTVTIDDSVAALGPNAEEIIQLAFGRWLETKAALPALTFAQSSGQVPLTTAPDGVNSVLYGPIDVPGHENDLAITIGFKSDDGDLLESDIIINSNHPFALLNESEMADFTAVEDGSDAMCASQGGGPELCGTQFDLQSVMTHEIGHFWGLGEDNDRPDATMYLCTSHCEVHKRSLHEEDELVIEELYPIPPTDAHALAVPAAVPNAACQAKLAKKGPAGLWVALCLGVLGLRLRRRG